jgi:hypothetical protein
LLSQNRHTQQFYCFVTVPFCNSFVLLLVHCFLILLLCNCSLL